jgi:hypothetical protein
MLSYLLLFTRFGLGLREIRFEPGRVLVQVKTPVGVRRIIIGLALLLLAVGLYGLYALGPGWADDDRVDAALQTLTALAVLAGAWLLPQRMSITATPALIEVARETLTGTVRTSEPTKSFSGVRLHHSLQDTAKESPAATSIRLQRYRHSLHTGSQKIEYWWIEAIHPDPARTVFLHMVRGAHAPNDMLHKIATTLELDILPAAGDR